MDGEPEPLFELGAQGKTEEFMFGALA